MHGNNTRGDRQGIFCSLYFFFYIDSMLHRFASILLCVCLSANSFIPLSDNAEIGRLRHLVEHFQEHQQAEAISFIDFLLKHYSPFSKHSTSSSNDHHSLPFHAPLSTGHSAASPYLHVVANHTLFLPVQTLQKFRPLPNKCQTFLLYTSIFQPPKVS